MSAPPRSAVPVEPRLAVVVVNYDGWPDALALAGRLAAEPEVLSGACRVVVVDNASPTPIPDAKLFREGGLGLVSRPDNGGFAVGVNAGWRACPAPWLLLLNPDVDVEPGFLGRVMARIDAHEARPGGPPGIVGFALLNEDGTPQGSVGTFPGLLRMLREQFIPRRRRKYVPASRLRPGPIDWATGACLLIDGRLMAETGGFDEDFFLYHEEVAFCRVAANLGRVAEYDPAVVAVHRKPLQDRAISPKMRVVIRHGKLLYFRKHLPRPTFLVLAAVVTAEAAIRGGWARIRGAEVARRAWREIAAVARDLRRGDGPVGREVIERAERAVAEPRWTGPGPSRPKAERTSAARRRRA